MPDFKTILAVLAASSRLAVASQAELVVQTGHMSVHSASFSPDGRLIVTAGENAAILWDRESGAELRVFLGHTEAVKSAVFSPSGKLVLTASADGTARLWDPATGKEVKRIVPPKVRVMAAGREHNQVTGVESAIFSPDGTKILTGGSDGIARLWDAGSGEQILQLTTTWGTLLGGSATCVAFSPDGRQILTGTRDKTVQLWDAIRGSELRRFEGRIYPYDEMQSPYGEIAAVAFSPTGRVALTGSNDRTPRMWDTRTGQEFRWFQASPRTCGAIAFSKDGGKVATGWGSKVQIWDAASGRLILKVGDGRVILDETGKVIGNTEGTLGSSSIAFSPDGRFVLVGEDMGGAGLWDATTGKLIRRFKRNALYRWKSSIAFSKNGLQLLTDGPFLWDMTTGQPNPNFSSSIETYESYPAALTPDGVILAARNQLYLCDPETGNVLLKFEAQPVLPEANPGLPPNPFHFTTPIATPYSISSVVSAPERHLVLTTAPGSGVRLWNTRTGKKTAEFPYPSMEHFSDTERTNSSAFSPDGSQVLSAGSDKIVRLWDATTGREIRKFEPFNVPPPKGLREVFWDRDETDIVAFAPDGKQFATAGLYRGKVRIWDKNSGKEVRQIQLSDTVEAVTFSPNGRMIATGGWDGVLRFWDVDSGQRVRELRGHAGAIKSIAFAPAGNLLASSGDDGTVRLWRAAEGTLVATLINFSDGTWTVVDPQGRFDTNSLDGSSELRWTVPDEPFRALPIEIFTRQYFIPNLLRKLLRREKLPDLPSIAEINRVQPVVGKPVIEPDPKDPDLVRARVKVAQQSDGKRASGLKDLRIFRNGQLVRVQEGDLENREYRFDGIRLPHEKSTEFSAYAFNDAFVKSDTARATYERSQAPPAPKRRTFLLNIGVNRYRAAGCDLDGAASDAVALSRALESHLPLVNARILVSEGATAAGASKESIKAAFSEIARQATPDDIFIFSFSGHGFNDKNDFYISPSDLSGNCSRPDDHLLSSAISTSELMEWLRPLDAGEMVMILDTCFSAASIESGDFKPAPLGNKVLGQLAYDKRMRILTASQSTQVAREAPGLNMGLLTYALVKEGLTKKGADGRLRLRDWLSYGRQRVPELFSELSAIKVDKNSGSTRRTDDNYVQMPGFFDFTAKNNLGIELTLEDVVVANTSRSLTSTTATTASSGGLAPRPPRTIPSPAALTSGLQPSDMRVNPKDSLHYVWIPSGTFRMGCSDGDSECKESERPAHHVELTKGFWMGQTSVTVGAWRRYRNETGKPALPGSDTMSRKINEEGGNDNMPVVDMTWAEAKGFCEWSGGRLPTEAEWEYAARAGSTSARYGDLDEIAWSRENSGDQRIDSAHPLKQVTNLGLLDLLASGIKPHVVGQKQPNAWKVYDMLGNVKQWTADWYDANYYQVSPPQDPSGPPSGQFRSARGGSWFTPSSGVRVSSRSAGDVGSRLNYDVGFRCVAN